MALFVGTYENKLDTKGRVSLPAAYRAELQPVYGAQSASQERQEGEEMNAPVIYLYKAPGRDGVIEGCDHGYIERLGKRIEALRHGSEERRVLERSYIAKAKRINLDQGGRFMLPKFLKTHAKITDSCLFVGCNKKFEIFNAETDPFKDDVEVDPALLERAWNLLDKIHD